MKPRDLSGRALWTRLVLFCLVLAATVGTRALQAQSAPSAIRFPHAKHEKLFPQCAGCHAGLTTGTKATMFPDTTLCVSCHNRRDQPRVDWRAPTRTASNLRFDHSAHRDMAGSEGASCTTCHARAGDRWMQVSRAQPAQCQSCHTHRTSDHLAPENRCSSCHLPLTQARALSPSRIAAFPKPASHTDKAFAAAHGPAATAAPAQCAMCHARETCATCHVNAGRIASRFDLAPDARVAGLVRGKKARYVTPASHRAGDFTVTHGEAAQQRGATCESCHARASCTTCHTRPPGRMTATDSVIARLPVPGAADAAGVSLGTSILPWQARQGAAHPAGFTRTHGVQAATDRPSCEGCHTKSYCAQCHAGESTRRFHAANFVMRHAPEAYGRETDCQQCHSREVFCRSCHLQAGLGSKSRTGGGYHNGAPLWIIQHGQAARQELQSCTTCHQQKDCMQCHSQGGRRINPHGSNFNAEKAWKANRLTCLRCHFKDPFGR
jgi:hypothetical protein